MLRALVTVALAAVLAGACMAQDSSPSPAASPQAGPASPAASASPAAGGAEVAVDPKSISSQEQLGPPNPKLVDQKTKASYALGFKFGSDLVNALKRMDISMDTPTMLDGVHDAVTTSRPAVSVKELEKAIEGYITEQRKLLADKNKKDGEGYLAENKKKAGVKVTASGLQYEVVKEGTGPKPTDKDTVSVNYKGTLVNGTEFDSSYKRGEPATFPVQGVIPGWSEALKLMPVGSRWKLAIPSDLAYGAQGMPPRITPNQVLLFEVELLEIKGAPGAGASPAASPEASPEPSPSSK